MLGAIIGDIAGSRFEWGEHKSKEFTLLCREKGGRLTDDSVMTLAVARAILSCAGDWDRLPGEAVWSMRDMGRRYPAAGYGGRFLAWLQSDDPKPYHSYGNGAAMRVSPCGFAARSLEEAVLLAGQVTGVTHDHPEGMKAAAAVASAVYLAKSGSTLEEIREHITSRYYPIDFTLDEIRPAYRFDMSCQGSVPQAFAAFFEARDFEDAVRGAVSIGGDSDTIAAIAGGMAEARFGIPEALRAEALTYLDERQREILDIFARAYV